METTFIEDPQLELRSEGTHRMLSVRCVPYGQISHKAGPRPEKFRHGAFAGAIANASKIRLRQKNHDRNTLPVGVAERLEERDDGLYGVYRFYDTVEGRAAIENVAEGVYGGVSVGFIAVEDADVDGVREIRRAKLDHVSLVESPAYEDARILALRSAADYQWLRKVPAVQLPDDDDTPMLVRIEQMYR